MLIPFVDVLVAPERTDEPDLISHVVVGPISYKRLSEAWAEMACEHFRSQNVDFERREIPYRTW